MGIFGVDVSNHQKTFDFRGWDFAFIKSSEGNGFRDAYFQGHLTNARNAGCLVGAYHYVREVSAQSQFNLIRAIVPIDVPVILDIEHNSGPLSIARELCRLLKNDGYRVPFTYLPRWYWNQIGQPYMNGLPALWASWYPDYVSRPPLEGIAKVPSSAWTPYGGLQVAMMQFTSTPYDQNYFPGTRDQLAAILNGRAPGGGSGDVSNMPAWDQVVNAVSPNDPSYSENHPYGYIESATFYRVSDMYNVQLPALKEAVENIELGGVDLDLLADKVAAKMLEKLDVDLVARPGS